MHFSGDRGQAEHALFSRFREITIKCHNVMDGMLFSERSNEVKSL